MWKGTTWTGNQGTPEWLALKADGPVIDGVKCATLGGSTIGSVLGNSAFCSSSELARRIAGFEPPLVANDAMHHGTLTEPVACAAYAEDAGVGVEHVGAIRPVVAGLDPSWLIVSPDGLVGSEGCIEIKCPKKMPRLLVDLDPDADPRSLIYPNYYDQMQLVMASAGRAWCDHVVYVTGPSAEMVVIRVPFDRAYWEDEMVPAVRNFFHEVVPRVIRTERKMNIAFSALLN